MNESITFDCPLPPGPLRRNRETAHKGFRAALVRAYQEQVWCAGHMSGHSLQLGAAIAPPPFWYESMPWPKARLTLTWRHHRVGPDADNALASCKYLIDVLKATGPRPLGIFRDDSPDYLEIMPMQIVKIRSKAEEGITVLVERVA